MQNHENSDQSKTNIPICQNPECRNARSVDAIIDVVEVIVIATAAVLAVAVLHHHD